ncbi:MAG: hypothetical protein ABI895_34935 [Deltaproteobacteria bacterium]
MPTTTHDEPHCKTLEFRATAEWSCHDVPACDDAAATPFGPLVPVTKPVLYIPVKKQNGKETFPALRIHVTVTELGELRNVRVPCHQGAQIEIKVWNVWGGKRRGPVQLKGALDANDACAIVVSSATVEEWLDPSAELGGRVNELLLDFELTLPTLTVKGQALKGESKTRVYLYRRKVILFLPGVFGSKVQMKMPDGRTLGFPDFYPEPSLGDVLQDFVAPYHGVRRHIDDLVNQNVGGLECDASGRPLVEPIKPTIFSARGVVYDVFDDCRHARTKYFSGVPGAFRLVELQVLAYDWRTDLLECAQVLAAKLEALQAHLRTLPDVDDEVALAGHSTGGLIIRRALGEPGMQSRVSHAFFISVPFLGAPKALSVILTGQDPPGGDSMIYFVSADSLRDGALSMPIVYHLAPSAAYPGRAAFTPSRPTGASPSIEDDKRDLVETAISAGFRPRPRFVQAGRRSAAERALLAASADSWHTFWERASERLRAQELYDAMFPRGHAQRDAWMANELRSGGLEHQYAARGAGGWNVELAARAEKFHRESLEIDRSEAWAEKAYVFYSIDPSATTLSVHLERTSETEFAGPLDLLKDEHIPMLRFLDGEVEPPRGEEQQALPEGGTVPAPTVNQWARANGRCRKVVWRLWGKSAKAAGDATVPLASLLGCEGRARFAPPISKGSNTAHKDTPKEGSIWLLIMRSLQGTWAPQPITGREVLQQLANLKAK